MIAIGILIVVIDIGEGRSQNIFYGASACAGAVPLIGLGSLVDRAHKIEIHLRQKPEAPQGNS